MALEIPCTEFATTNDGWHSFTDVLDRLHAEGVYIRADQLAEFFLRHGLPVSLDYVPVHLKSIALKINQHYQGDMARLEGFEQEEDYTHPHSLAPSPP